MLSGSFSEAQQQGRRAYFFLGCLHAASAAPIHAGAVCKGQDCSLCRYPSVSSSCPFFLFGWNDRAALGISRHHFARWRRAARVEAMSSTRPHKNRAVCALCLRVRWRPWDRRAPTRCGKGLQGKKLERTGTKRMKKHVFLSNNHLIPLTKGHGACWPRAVSSSSATAISAST